MGLAYQPSEKAEHHMYSMPMLLTIASNAHHVEYLLVILSLSAYSSQLGNIWIGESPVGRLKRKLKFTFPWLTEITPFFSDQSAREIVT